MNVKIRLRVGNEISQVSDSNAASEEIAMMISLQNASITNYTMMRTWWTVLLTCHTKSP